VGLFNTIASDIGRPLLDPHASPELSGTGAGTFTAAFEDLKPTLREVSSVDGDWFVSRVQPYASATTASTAPC